MEQDKFDNITVTQITQEADIARQIVLDNGVRSFEHDVILFFRFWKSHSEVLYLLQLQIDVV